LCVAQTAEKRPGTSTRLLWINIEEEEAAVEHCLTAYRQNTKLAFGALTTNLVEKIFSGVWELML